MHVHGHGTPADLANKIKPALDLIGKNPPRNAAAVAGRSIEGKLDVAELAKVIGHEGEQNGAVYKITIGRSDLSIKEMARQSMLEWDSTRGRRSTAAIQKLL
jgi:hypothetical protein